MKYVCILFCICISSCESFAFNVKECRNKLSMNQVGTHKYENLTQSRRRTKLGNFSNDFFHKFHFVIDLIEC